MKESKSRVSIIIPNYDGKEYLKRLLPSVANQTYSNHEVIILDDHSPDRCAVEYIKAFVRDRDNMRLVENEENLGFVRNCNKGFSMANGDYICLLNNDTEVKSNFVQRNVEILDADSSIGVLSCVIVDQHGHIWFSGGEFKAGLRVNLRDDFQGIRSVDWVAGTAPFYRRDLLNRVGFLSEAYFMYHEDIEFGLRVRNKTDYWLCMFSEKLVTHYLEHLDPDSPKLKRLYYYGHRNHILILREYYPKYLPKLLMLYLKEIINLLVVSVFRLNPKLLLTVISIAKGTLAGLIKRQTKLQARRSQT